ncbi:hypothetical protein [Lysinibacillus sp. LZ02]|uniref:hypothetical protein n=1 Tax=Lysinibacillus sp. LZ02 TaxID=3420668 RepID=UPI003D35B239
MYGFFKHDWQQETIFSNYIFMRYTYMMYRLQALEKLEVFIEKGKETLRSFILELQEEQHTDPLDIEHENEVLNEYVQQLAELEPLLKHLQNGFVPPMQYAVFATGVCKLYGCSRHGYLELTNMKLHEGAENDD